MIMNHAHAKKSMSKVRWFRQMDGKTNNTTFIKLLTNAVNNKSVFSLVNSAVNMTLPAFAAGRRVVALLLLSTDTCYRSMFCPWGTQQQTCCTPLLLLNDGTDR